MYKVTYFNISLYTSNINSAIEAFFLIYLSKTGTSFLSYTDFDK